MKKKSKNTLFIELAKPNEKGISKWVNISKFKGEYSRLSHSNGRDWGRNDDSRFPYKIEQQKEGNKIVEYRCGGIKYSLNRSIRSDLIKKIKQQKCLLLGTSKPEVDHKNGRKNDLRVGKLKNQRLSDFQPLSKAANDAKRQHCKSCAKTNKRFDARKLGFEKSFTVGNIEYLQSPDGCVGCFWFDVRDFQKKVKIT